MSQSTDAAPSAPPQGPNLLDVAAIQAAALLAVEASAAAAVSGPLLAALHWLQRQSRARFLLAEASGQPTAAADARAWTVQQLHRIAETHLGPDTVVPALQAVVRRAQQTGMAHVAEQVAVQAPVRAPLPFPAAAVEPAPPPVVTLSERLALSAPPSRLELPAPRRHLALSPGSPEAPPSLTDAVARAAHDTALHRIEQAAKALDRATRPADLSGAFTIALRAPDDLGLAAAWIVNHTSNAVARDEAIRRGALLLWIAERDACVVCLALAGHTANVLEGEGFDEFATFGPHRPPEPWPPGRGLTGPPRHPHCRCQTVVYFGVQAGQPDYAAVLRREAIRSILRGYSRPSESHRTRLVAAERALRSGAAANAPKSVRAYAASAVLAGKFPTRAVPVGPARQPRRAA